MKKKVFADSISYKAYSKEVMNFPTMNTKREKQIKALMLDPNTTESEKQQLKDELVTGCLRYVFSLANKFKGSGLELEDLISEGNMGLMIAIEKFDWTKSNKFITFANQWIRHEILMAIYNHARSIRLPVNIAMQLHKEIKEMNETNNELSDEMANLPSTSELDRKVGEDGTFLDILKNVNAELPDSKIEFESTVNYLLSRLDERSANVIKLLYGLEGEELDIKEVADKLDIHKETVRQIKIKAIEKLEKRINLIIK